MAEARPEEASHVTQNDIYHEPWKYTGYKKYSWFLASDDNFLIFRRFGTLNARVILFLQDKISEAEERLKALDDECSLKSAPRNHNGSFRLDQRQERNQLIIEIKEMLKEYNEFIVNHTNIRSRPRVSLRDIEYVKNWHVTNEGAINSKEHSYLDQTDDLAHVTARFRTPLRRFLEKSSRFGWLSCFRREPQDQTYYDRDTMYYELHERLDKFVTFIVCFVGLIMLIAPLWIMNFVGSSESRLEIITTFIIVFLCLIQSVTIAKPFESLAATAAYSAVLMVFMQNGVA